MYRGFFLRSLLALSFVFFHNLAWAQSSQGNWQREPQTSGTNASEVVSMLPIFQQDLGGAAVNNIINAENVFCYHVSSVPEGYSGYTIDGVALTGFCGMVGDNLRNVLFRLFFATADFLDTKNTAQCVMVPRLMLRYVRGVDYTDVLVSSPCQSLAIFYGGKVVTYNFAPVAQVFDAMVNAFQDQNMAFVSPALLNQVVPVGYPVNAEQQRLVNQNKVQNTVRNMPVRQQTTSTSASQGGWSNLKVNIQR